MRQDAVIEVADRGKTRQETQPGRNQPGTEPRSAERMGHRDSPYFIGLWYGRVPQKRYCMKSEGEALRPQIAAWAAEWGYLGEHRFSFRFPEIRAKTTPTYNPDCVWFDGEIIERSAVAIFEIDKDPSRKH